jgi:hypothetical protein
VNESTRFWLDWIVQSLVAVGTLGAVAVALFGDWFKSWFVQLTLSVENPLGVYTPETIGTLTGNVVTEQRQREARYFHVRVMNASKVCQAHRVDVYLLSVVEYGGDGAVSRKWIGEIPLIWQHQAQMPGPRTIGNPANVDVFAVNSDGALKLQPLIQPLNLQRQYHEPCHLILTVQVRSDDGNSPEVRLLVRWDGQWERDSEVMAKHVEFRIVD